MYEKVYLCLQESAIRFTHSDGRRELQEKLQEAPALMSHSQLPMQ